MKVNFTSGFIKLPNLDTLINPNMITYINSRTGKEISVHTSDGEYFVTDASIDAVVNACTLAQEDNAIVNVLDIRA